MYLREVLLYSLIMLVIIGSLTLIAQFWLSKKELECKNMCLLEDKEYKYIPPKHLRRFSTPGQTHCFCVEAAGQ